MEGLDIRIMRELFRGEQAALVVDRRKSFRNIASIVGVDGETVRRRIARLQRMGLLRGWVAVANPNLLGVRVAVLIFDVYLPASKDELIPSVRSLPGVVLFGNFLGSALVVILFYESERSLEEATRFLFGPDAPAKMVRYDSAFPPCKIALSRTDWILLGIVQRDPFRSFRLLARDLGISSKTVKRRLDRLVRGKALFVVPKLDVTAAEGDAASLIVGYTDSVLRAKVDREILSRWNDFVFALDLNSQTHSLFLLILKNAAQAKDVSTWMKGLSGVSSFRLDIFQERVELWEPYHDLVERRKSSAGRTP